uniref:Uncharacterized protein n=1 Tax=Bradyrhizobium amphicarpaeae TaxID=1404768 RepID=A0A2U8PLE1_9BRAD|nr:hypothetical protein CIT40_00030 [Bradyrhizobium amphicarpaeae]AWM04403.1 hypothetical protein CIT40_33100 [Bradyrhizobium amphicarpaeae]
MASFRRECGALPPPFAGEGWGEGVSTSGQSPRGESPHPDRSRDPTSPASKRERCTEIAVATPRSTRRP